MRAGSGSFFDPQRFLRLTVDGYRNPIAAERAVIARHDLVLGPLLNLVLIGRIDLADQTIADLLYRFEPAFAAVLKATDRIAVVRIRLSFPGHRPGNHDDVLVVVKDLLAKMIVLSSALLFLSCKNSRPPGRQ
jgi:hypothetical protein